MKTRQAGRYLVVTLAGTRLSEPERAYLQRVEPAGVMLFSRNIEQPEQVVALIRAIRQQSPSTVIWIDQEGGRVQRLRCPLTRLPAAESFAKIYAYAPQQAERLARQCGALAGRELRAFGIGINCAPVVDIPAPGADPVIGNRAFGDNPLSISRLAGAWLQGLQEAGVMGVAKHFPGHGDAMVDSHRSLPVVHTEIRELLSRTWVPYVQLLPLLQGIMTAHLVMSALDPLRPATWSSVVLKDWLRQRLGYGGLIISDALEMGALGGNMEDRAARAVRAGCDQLLVCSGRLNHMQQALNGVQQALGEKSPQEQRQDAQRIEAVLQNYRISPGDWQKVVADPAQQALKERLQRMVAADMGRDPTEVG
ncbi:Beta-N-acetylhexosaminidase [Magnetococcus marinus MC-1]|uniref:beta-N-acetylhexosaminidase n=1 Tax=Magnetococcus marinus (strain ATCC BAA-1437 / JCM 17883 / MC-1) TaxID=156889 RepID=A0L847_MAGMM|nr:beta-N-acetylhexosaminidase [Magnetococcus marinus]ABK44140.1 Beta-N-acetylhexosaminidase [Magnetococcus marinus MC-1]